ncbi:uncharacterized protein PHACADRAFT_213998 [Phanerochaete carnosa HHB-10118-sp]|uniref:Uncharacterized protein n=1 Tax=Phanerochaete carnosa (strain HHB-10118-sp) TaxID=650164 RepID=K5UKV4_PHACS|nr:uncharacterized protein PHACADRAFT_213998 [Phanerochaete carnosa HHB-10118-sp]EKM50276.1 hypothetical protein PHACADRAFT_213998 [Phanerochaete carnosa HHB-10118-sp]
MRLNTYVSYKLPTFARDDVKMQVSTVANLRWELVAFLVYIYQSLGVLVRAAHGEKACGVLAVLVWLLNTMNLLSIFESPGPLDDAWKALLQPYHRIMFNYLLPVLFCIYHNVRLLTFPNDPTIPD